MAGDTERSRSRSHSRPRQRQRQRNRLRLSCDVCYRRKVKCNTQQPCDRCIRSGCEDQCRISKIHVTNECAPRHSRESTPRHPTHDSASFSERIDLDKDHEDTVSPSLPGELFEDEVLGHFVAHSSNSSKSLLSLVERGASKGFSHFSWLLDKFDFLIQHIDNAMTTMKMGRKISFKDRKMELIHERRFHDIHTIQTAHIFDEIPPYENSKILIGKFFETFGVIFPIVDQHALIQEFESLVECPGNGSISFVIKILLIICIGNVAMGSSTALVQRADIRRWLDLSTSWQNAAVEAAHFDLEIVRLFFLITLARQLCRLNETADWISCGLAVRGAMTIGLNRKQINPAMPPDPSGSELNVWESILELDLQTSLVSGMLPTAPPEAYRLMSPSKEDGGQHTLSPKGIKSALRNTLQTRYKIVYLLNGNAQANYQRMIQLSRELTKGIGSVPPGDALLPLHKFCLQYPVFVYKQFLMAIHLPFALEDDAEFHLSRTVCSNLSSQCIQHLCNTHKHQDSLQSDIFENSASVYGTLHLIGNFQAIMFLSHELLKGVSSPDDRVADPSVMDPIYESAHKQQLIEDFIPVAERFVEKFDTAGKVYLIPSITLAYIKLLQNKLHHVENHETILADEAAKIAARCFSLWTTSNNIPNH